MYTGYYAKAKHYADCGLVPVAISLHPPVWFDGLRYPLLAPSASILNGYLYQPFGLGAHGFPPSGLPDVFHKRFRVPGPDDACVHEVLSA